MLHKNFSFRFFALMAFVLLTSAVFLNSCGKDDDEDPTTDEFNVLNYDGVNIDAPELPGGRTYEAAARFTTNLTNEHVGKKLEEITYYVKTRPNTCRLKIYKGSLNDNPGSLIYEADVLSATNSDSWNTHALTNDIIMESSDYWVSIEFSHNDLQRTIGCDAGPAALNGEWTYDSTDNSWLPLSNRSSVNINWNIRAHIEK